MGFEPTIFRDLVGCSTTELLESKGQIVGIDWNRIARLHSHVLPVQVSCLQDLSLSTYYKLSEWRHS